MWLVISPTRFGNGTRASAPDPMFAVLRSDEYSKPRRLVSPSIRKPTLYPTFTPTGTYKFGIKLKGREKFNDRCQRNRRRRWNRCRKWAGGSASVPAGGFPDVRTAAPFGQAVVSLVCFVKKLEIAPADNSRANVGILKLTNSQHFATTNATAADGLTN